MAIQSDWKDPWGSPSRGKRPRRKLRRASDRRNAAVAALGEWLIRRQWRPVFLVDEALTLISSNGAARKTLQQTGWLRQNDRQIEILDPALDKVLKDALKRWPKPRSESVILSSSDKRIDLAALKLDHHLPTVYVLTILELPETPVNAARVLCAAGLTELQASVALLIYEGRSQISAADRLAKSVNTVKSHLQGIYLKVGVRSERELTRWVGELLARESS